MSRTLEHLRRLVATDTRNPPRSSPAAAVDYLKRTLRGGFKVEVIDHGDGCISTFAVRGNPRVLFNFHIDTVPESPGWDTDPFSLHVTSERAYGLGSADTKGSAAAMLSAIEGTEADVALLFTSDEEASGARCVCTFLKRALPFDMVVVSEPTSLRAVFRHRAIVSGTVTFTGQSGHSSHPDVRSLSAVHALIDWASDALAHTDELEKTSGGDLPGVRFNVGAISGGVKSNVIAATAAARFAMRPSPAIDPDALLETIRTLGNRTTTTLPRNWDNIFVGPALPAFGGSNDMEARARVYAEKWGVESSPAVNFWTETALFSQAGYPAFVLGAGSIEQAHAANEFVPIDDLNRLAEMYLRILETERRS